MTARTIAARILTAGVGLGTTAWFFAPASSPAQSPAAAWLRPAAPAVEPVARGADPDAVPFPSMFPTAQTPKPALPTSPWATTVMQPTAPLGPRSGPPAPPQKKDEPTMLGRAWNNVKESFNGPPKPTIQQQAPGNPFPFPPSPRPATVTAPVPAGAIRMPIVPGAAGPVGAPRVYTVPPAYRWYGWGSTTPGQNVYAPDGQTYPSGSARWFTSTGATPGAFPVSGGPVVARTGAFDPPGYSAPSATPLIGTFPGPKAAVEATPRVETKTATVTPPSAVPVTPLPKPPVAHPVLPESNALALPAATPEPIRAEPLQQVLPTVPVTGTGEMLNTPLPPARPPKESEPAWQPAQIPTPTAAVPPIPVPDLIPAAATVVVPQKPKETPKPTSDKEVEVVFPAPAARAESADPDWAPAKTVLATVTNSPVAPTTTSPLPPAMPAPAPSPAMNWIDASAMKKIEPVVSPVPAASPTPPMANWVPSTSPKPSEPAAAAAPLPAVTSAPDNKWITPTTMSLGDDHLFDLERVARDASRAHATVMELTQSKPGKLTVRLIASSDALAAEAAKVITQLPQFKPYAVEFDTKVVGK